MKITNEQIKAILDGAPEGATHCTDTVPSMNLYAKVEHLGGFYVSLSNRWESYPIYAGIHLLSDLREILALRQRVQELETQVRSIALSRNELAATVERFRAAILTPPQNDDDEWCNVNKVALQTPQQNLNAVKREVAKRAIVDFGSVIDTSRCNENDIIQLGEEYANETYPDKDDE